MNVDVKRKMDAYPKDVRVHLDRIRELIICAAKQDGIDDLTETLKWGEPSYVSKIGSTIRIDWKAKKPKQYGVYFNCKTTLVETFREVYGELFQYDGNRAIIFKLGDSIPCEALEHCLSMALRYKKIKHLKLLGA